MLIINNCIGINTYKKKAVLIDVFSPKIWESNLNYQISY